MHWVHIDNRKKLEKKRRSELRERRTHNERNEFDRTENQHLPNAGLMSF